MPPDAFRPASGSPADWLRFARADLALARQPLNGDVLVELLCFHAQQCAEKSLKALLIAAGKPLERTHNIQSLMDALPSAMDVPSDVQAAASLTDYGVTVRYPGRYEEIEDADYQEALRLAHLVLEWAMQTLSQHGFL